MNSESKVNIGAHVSTVVEGLLLAERRTALVTRCRPVNMQAECERLVAELRAGRAATPEFRYAAAWDSSGVRAHLQALARNLWSYPLGELYVARIEELLLEVALVDALGTKAMTALSRRRYETGFEQQRALSLACEWSDIGPSVETELVASDDLGDERSLLRRMQSWVGRERLPVRVEVSPDLVSLAATGEGFIVVAAGRKLSPEDAERVAVHEVLGHARPRVRSRAQRHGLFAVGSRGGNDTQEGYAVHCEQRAGVLHAGRRFELGLRHLACLGVWEGLPFYENAKALMAKGAPLEMAVQICVRAYRGGGLAREASYLPAYCAVVRAVAAAPDVADWLAAGRLGLDAIDTLREVGYRLV